MKTKTIRLASSLEVPLNITTQKIAIMGGNGSGKTYTALKIEEEILEADGWVIVVDPVGVHYGLRLAKDGKKPSGLNIPVFGGLHGDVILSPDSGKMVADLICDRRLSVVLDISQFESDSDVNRFATDFGNQFWNRMKAQRRAVLLVLEECQEFVPQNPMKGEERKLHVFTRIAKLGRNYGVGVMLISQRPQDVNKKVLNLTQLMFAFQSTGIQERKTMSDWFSYVGYDSDLGEVLPTLEVGEPYVMSPRWLKVNQKFKILPKKTFDASATPDFDDDSTATVHLNPIDISTLEQAMSRQIEEAKQNDPVHLKKEVLSLRKQLENRPVSKPVVETVEVPVFREGELKGLADLVLSLNELSGHIIDTASKIVTATKELQNSLIKANQTPRPAVPKRPWNPPMPSRKSEPKENFAAQEGISNPQQRILDAMAWMESVGLERPKRTVIAFLSDQSPRSSGYKNNLSSLRAMGYLQYGGSDTLIFEEAGRRKANPVTAPITSEELQESITSKLPGPQAKILWCLIHNYPNPVSRDAVAEQSNQSPTSSGYKNNLSSLRSLGVIEYAGADHVVALPVLFLE